MNASIKYPPKEYNVIYKYAEGMWSEIASFTNDAFAADFMECKQKQNPIGEYRLRHKSVILGPVDLE